MTTTPKPPRKKPRRKADEVLRVLDEVRLERNVRYVRVIISKDEAKSIVECLAGIIRPT